MWKYTDRISILEKKVVKNISRDLKELNVRRNQVGKEKKESGNKTESMISMS